MYSYKPTYLLDKELNTKTGTEGVMSTNSTQKLIYAMYVPSAMSLLLLSYVGAHQCSFLKETMY